MSLRRPPHTKFLFVLLTRDRREDERSVFLATVSRNQFAARQKTRFGWVDDVGLVRSVGPRTH